MFVRGDLISNLDEDEGATLLKNLMNMYLRDSEYEKVHQFNHTPDKFDYTDYINRSLNEFAKLKAHIIETKPPALELGKVKKYGHKTNE